MPYFFNYINWQASDMLGMSQFHKYLWQNAVTKNRQKIYSALRIQMDQTRRVDTETMPKKINKSQTGWK